VAAQAALGRVAAPNAVRDQQRLSRRPAAAMRDRVGQRHVLASAVERRAAMTSL
jgi:hypothetical protein